MKLREKIKRFWTLDVHGHEGFTLVELIIVIAILAILSSVAVVGYSSYVEKANKQADRTLVAEVVNALTLHYYSSQGGDMVVAVVLTDKGATAEGFAADALDAAYGAGSWDNLKLKYNDWGRGAQIASNALAYMTSYEGAMEGIFNGTEVPGYVEQIDELYDMVENTAVLVAGKGYSDSGAKLIYDASLVTSGIENGEESFATAWASGTSFESYFMSEAEGEDTLISIMGARKARNVAMATYIKSMLMQNLEEYGSTEYTVAEVEQVYNAIVNCTESEGNSRPMDLGAGSVDTNVQTVLTRAQLNENSTLLYLTQVLAAKYKEEPVAKTDGLGYYALMSTVSEISDDTNLTDDTYWDDMSSGIDMYKAVLAGVDVSALNTALGSVSGNSVAIVMYVVNGELTFVVSPTGAKSE